MPIEFEPQQWSQVRKHARQWWAGELDRPLILARLQGYDPGRPAPELPDYEYTSHYTDASPQAVVDRWDYNLSCTRFLGDAFPTVRPNFGACVVAAFLGAQLVNRPDTVWFQADRPASLAELEWHVDCENPVFARVRDIVQAAQDRWQGDVLIGMTDLSGILDILSVFRPGEELLFDLYDQPERIKQHIHQLQQAWWRYFDSFASLTAATNPGYAAWDGMYSETPFYMLQCDFAYMISPAMFRQFVQPELIATADRLDNAFYHMDGPGQIRHLAALLEIDALKGIQWVPGAGQPDIRHWPELYRRIREAGKLIQIFSSQCDGSLDALDILTDQLGTAEGIVFMVDGFKHQEEDVLRLLERYNIASQADPSTD